MSSDRLHEPFDAGASDFLGPRRQGRANLYREGEEIPVPGKLVQRFGDQAASGVQIAPAASELGSEVDEVGSPE